MTLQNTRSDLVLDGVSKSFGTTKAVDDVSISVAPGEFFSLLGPSGCGKTTTLRLVAGFEIADEGSIAVRGEDITVTPPERRPVNTVFQQYALFPHMSVSDNVGFGLRQRKLGRDEKAKRLSTALETVRLTELVVRYPRELSGGQQQRVALARALINEPAVLLLDEPLAALDLKLRKAMQAELKGLQERVDVTFLYVTHDQEEALTLSDRIAVMDAGKILQIGTPEEIYERPTHRFVADFIGETNLLDGEVVDVASGWATVKSSGGLVMRAAAPDGVSKGDVVSISLRPEKIGPSEEMEGAANRFEATVTRRLYLGNSDRIGLELAGHRLFMLVGRRSGMYGWKEGDVVGVAWEEGAAFVLTEDDGALADEADPALVESDR